MIAIAELTARQREIAELVAAHAARRSRNRGPHEPPYAACVGHRHRHHAYVHEYRPKNLDDFINQYITTGRITNV